MLTSIDLSKPVAIDPGNAASLFLPLAGSSVRAGFPSPAEDFTSARIDLSKELIAHPQCTFILRVSGDSMESAGILDNSLLVVDKYLRPEHGDIVVAEVDGEFTCKRLLLRNDQLILRAENPTYPDIRPKDGQTIVVWGVVTASITRHRRV